MSAAERARRAWWPADDPVTLPPVPAYLQPVDEAAFNGPDWRLYWQERAAARDAARVEQLCWLRLEHALKAAREDKLDPDWRQRGLAEAVAAVEAGGSSRDVDVWVWLKINEGSRDFWEPGAVAEAVAAGVPVDWKTALRRWRFVLWSIKAAQDLDAGSVSRWAGFNLVWAYFNCDGRSQRWEAVLNRHEGSWPDTTLGYQGPWSETLSAHRLLQELDGIELSFDIGLAAGGEPIDWRGRHVQRISRWRMGGERENVMSQLQHTSPDHFGRRLPRTWMSQDSQSTS
ncbi:hypothetical protein A9W98_06655 [Mycobacterium gordonae]|uniref:Uncharacterized protein n=2 Tax=Mycobacterium TaxID=1763 RepID=A0ABY3V443_MYCLN|nr:MULTISPECIES: hypothetical protein [Mycobacterium]OBS04040.1 hypothetical protein A9W98_06655 [Mycobacterium gordonae]UCN13097.1 hypothetical protein LFT50_30800 [Mycobacterium intracellulare subsp. chimaera]ULP45604.1 hypothetical protein MJO58_28610 [Mycobacterium lentiflavum]